jgi:hypothetical protein
MPNGFALLAISDVVWQAGISGMVALGGALSAVLLAWMQYKTKVAVLQMGDKAAEAAEKAAEILEANTQATADKLKGMATSAAQAADDVKTTLRQTTAASNEKLKNVAGMAEEVRTTLKSSTQSSNDKLDDVAATLTGKLDTIGLVADATHTLVNGNMSVQMKLASVALRRIADLTNEPDDEKAAELAEKAYAEHQAKQNLINEGKG